VYWQLCTYFSGQHIVPIFKGSSSPRKILEVILQLPTSFSSSSRHIYLPSIYPSVTCIMRYFLRKMYQSSHRGTAVAQWLRPCATFRKVAGSIPAGVSGFFIDINYFRSHYGPEVDSASNTNEYQEYFLGVKAAGAYG